MVPVLYVEDLVAPGVVNTMPEATLRAFADHGDATRAFAPDARAPEETLRRAHEEGIDLAAVTAELEDDGVQSFCDSYGDLLACIAAKVDERERRWTSPSLAPATWRAGSGGG